MPRPDPPLKKLAGRGPHIRPSACRRTQKKDQPPPPTKNQGTRGVYSMEEAGSWAAGVRRLNGPHRTNVVFASVCFQEVHKRRGKWGERRVVLGPKSGEKGLGSSVWIGIFDI
ncbi:hypothetical protein PanWU01x14_102870 [Parasponia andersonii]|uniref:Uncharacterized protein n=1 Tax=Parasponia andersonii TaxID=3476 RepID=A0A2P5D2G7_PARAD|nr:hypothetical protein PanWU01x14_102870 [Parasponia andersonii]